EKYGNTSTRHVVFPDQQRAEHGYYCGHFLFTSRSQYTTEDKPAMPSIGERQHSIEEKRSCETCWMKIIHVEPDECRGKQIRECKDCCKQWPVWYELACQEKHGERS